MDLQKSGFPPELYRTDVCRVALEDYLVGQFNIACGRSAEGNRSSGATLEQALDRFDEMVQPGELMNVSPYDSGEYAAPRRYEVAAALNRLGTLRCPVV